MEFTPEEGKFLIYLLEGQKTWYYHQNKTNPMPIFQERHDLLKNILEKIEGKKVTKENYSIIHPLIKKLGNKNEELN